MTRRIFAVCSNILAVVPAIFALMAVGHPATAYADEVNLIPSMTVKEEYSDNMFFSSSVPRSGFVTAISPACEFFQRSEQWSGSARARLDAIYYRDNREDTTVLNHSYAGNYRFRPSPLLDVGLDAAYKINNRPDQSLDKNDLILNSIRRENQSYSVDTVYDFNELTAGKASYQFEQEKFDSPTLSDSITHSGTLRITRDLSSWIQPLSGIIEGGYSRYDFNSSSTDNYSLSLGGIWAFNETVSLTALMGGRYTRSQFFSTRFSAAPLLTQSEVTESSTSTGWVAQLELKKKGEVSSGTLAVNRTIAVSSGRNGAAETTALDGSFWYHFTPELSGSVTAGYQWNSSDAGQYAAGSLNQEYARLSTGLSYELFRELAVDVKYSLTRVMYRESGLSAERNAVFFGLTYKYPVLGR